MAVLPIHRLPDPVLRKKAKRVSVIDNSIRKLIADMIETMHVVPGVGLAAPQVGVSLRVIVFSVPDGDDMALINPEVVRRKGEQPVEEGCLSYPGYLGQFKRSGSVTVKGLDPEGREIRIKAEGLLAEILEHEIDHLNGILFLDHLESMDNLSKMVPGGVETEVREI